ncbi:cyclase family protein [Telluribacter sp.]|jgi:kynurenine formamidase|uniref:cyclase family protein n=1 Tax=Telluribacter sp. TaxID=1978767 RepID=UPI002E154659|nr:cyclase family protein [Telluribacter sp.]
MRLIDLTQTYQRSTPGVSWEPARVLEQDGWNATTLHLYSHAGTHVDAPLHFGMGQETIDTMPLEQLVGWAWVLRLPDTQPREVLTVAHLGELAGKISPQDSLLFYTNWSLRNGTDEYRDALPRIGEELARWLVDNKVKMIGVEPPSVADVNNLPEVTLIHRILLGGGITIVEGLCNLDQLRQEKVLLFALPLKYAGGDGAPARVIAVEGIATGSESAGS